MTPDLFESYPNTPGHRGVSTSIAGAKAIEPVAKTIQDRVLALLKDSNGYTTEELCKISGISEKSLQPRTAELRKLGKIVDSGLRRPSASGVNVIVWRAV